MVTAEAATAVGTRYVRDDPTLPMPWKGLIDGNTGFLYYWNPETNVTQYEKPAPLQPPLPLGLPPAASTPMLAPIPTARAMQPSGVLTQQGQQMIQSLPQDRQQMTPSSQQHADQVSQVAQQHSLQVAPVGQQQGSQSGTTMRLQGQLTSPLLMPQMIQQPGQQIFSQSEQQMPLQQAMRPMPWQLGQHTQIYQGTQIGQPQGYQFAHQQMQCMAYQQNVPLQGQAQHITQGHQLPHQPDTGFPLREDTDFQQGKLSGFFPSLIKPTGVPSVQSLPTGTDSVQAPHMGGQPGQTIHLGSSVNTAQPGSFIQLQRSGTDLAHQQLGPRFQNQMGLAIMHGQHPNVSPVSLKMDYGENPPGRARNEHFFIANGDGSVTVSRQPELAAIAMSRNQHLLDLSCITLVVNFHHFQIML